MEKTAIFAIAAVAILAVAGIGVAVVLNQKGGGESVDYSFDGAQLKVLGNANKDGSIDSKDVDTIKDLIGKSTSVKDAPMADANKDGKINQDDVDVVEKIIKGEKVTVWHINYYDTDGDSTMDTELVSTAFPVTSTIMTGSSNSFMMMYLLGITSEVKGASYGSTNDHKLYDGVYIEDKAKQNPPIVKLGTSSTSITFEDGKAGSSNVIADEKVTCLITDWNRTYIENWEAFEKANVDVVRVAAAATDKETYTHSILLLGLLFQKIDKSKSLLALYDKTFDEINKMVAKITDSTKKSGVASSMDAYVSSGTSDYQGVLTQAGLNFGLNGYNFNSSTSIKVADNPGIFDTSKYRFDYVVHIRTAFGYGTTSSEAQSSWDKYIKGWDDWENADVDGRTLMVSGVMPVPLRIVYTLYGVYSGVIDGVTLSWANDLHQEYITGFFHGANASLDADDLLVFCNARP